MPNGQLLSWEGGGGGGGQIDTLWARRQGVASFSVYSYFKKVVILNSRYWNPKETVGFKQLT